MKYACCKCSNSFESEIKLSTAICKDCESKHGESISYDEPDYKKLYFDLIKKHQKNIIDNSFVLQTSEFSSNCDEGANAFLWREKDATKNSIQSAASSIFSHKTLYKKTCNQMQDMLFKEGINWNDYPADFKRGAFFQKRKVSTKFSTEELDRLPAKHKARLNPELRVIRNVIIKLDMPSFVKVINRPEVIFLEGNPATDQRSEGMKNIEEILHVTAKQQTSWMQTIPSLEFLQKTYGRD